MSHLFENPETWVLVAFIVFVGLVSKKAYGFITVSLDERAARIGSELEEAARLREEAQALLSQYQRDHRGLETEIARILEQAGQEGDQITLAAEDKLKAQLAQREAQVQENMKHAEVQAFERIRSMASTLTVAASSELIRKNLSPEKASRLLDASIDEVADKLSAS